jgi:hypothetical protein
MNNAKRSVINWLEKFFRLLSAMNKKSSIFDKIVHSPKNIQCVASVSVW